MPENHLVCLFFSGSSSHCSTSADHTERAAKEADEKQTGGKAESTSIEEDVLTAANDSICSDSIHSVMEEKGIR